MLPIPRSLTDLTPSWMTAALAERCEGALVDSLELVDVVDGTNRRASVALHYAAGSGPPRVFVKAHGRMLHRLALLAIGALTAEARLLRSGVKLPLEHPLPYAAALDSRRLSSIVVIEDVTVAGGRPNAATTTLPVEQVRSGLDGLAALHAAHWDQPLPDALRFVRPWRLGGGWAPVSAANLARGVRRLRTHGREGLIPPGVSVGLLERQFRASAALAASGPQTLLHGDPHLGNTYTTHDGATGFYDWQLIRAGSWSHDVGYFLVSSLDVQSRRTHERDLLHGYLDALDRTGATPPPSEAAWERYCAAPAFGLTTWLHTFAAGSFQRDEDCLAILERFAAAYEDLQTLSAPALSRLTARRSAAR